MLLPSQHDVIGRRCSAARPPRFGRTDCRGFSALVESEPGAPSAKPPPRTLRVSARYTYIAVGQPAERH